jgi:exodeoxyribonuclease-5
MEKNEDKMLKLNEKLSKLQKISGDQKDNLESMIASNDTESKLLAEEILNLKIEEALYKDLNEGQLNAFVEIVNYVKDIDSEGIDGLILKGYAGTGKTFVITRVIEYIMAAYPKRKIAITAPTNKAVSVLYKNSKNNQGVFYDETQVDSKQKLVYSTIHKLLGLKEIITDTGDQLFLTGDSPTLTGFKYVIVDEVSMLDDKLLKDLMDFKDKIKFIFLGDPAQIPPVKKTDCMPFRNDCIYSFRHLILDQIMRQKGDNPIVDVSINVRENLGLKSPNPGLKTKLLGDKKGPGVIVLDNNTNKDSIAKVLRHHFTSSDFDTNPDHMKVIAWTNSTVKQVNEIVRRMRFGKSGNAHLDRFIVGDKIIASKALFNRYEFESFKYGVTTFYDVLFTTSTEFEIVDVNVHNEDFDEYKNDVKLCSIRLKVYSLKVKFYSLESESYRTNVIQVIHEDSLDDYNALLEKIRSEALRSKNKKKWVLYYNILKWDADIVYNYAITAHKSQGSTYENVMVLDNDIDMNNKIVERNRIRYTSYTRASKRLFIVN